MSRFLVVGHQKGRDTQQKVYRNFGYARPEGYRKALRAMKLAEKFDRPIITFIDTPAAYPGIESEERGVAEAIAFNLREMAMLTVPIVVAVIGEGGSGGALGLAVGDRILMQEYAVYGVIPPEGCAAILWRDTARKVEAADALKLTASDLVGLGVVDEVVPEPVGGAHADPVEAVRILDRRCPAPCGPWSRYLPTCDCNNDTTSSVNSAWSASTGCRARDHGVRRHEAGRRDGGLMNSRPTVRPLVWEHQTADEPRVSALVKALGIDPVIANLLVLRGIATPEDVERFLHPSLEHLHDPFQLADSRGGVTAAACH